MKSKNRQALPATNDVYLQVPARDGSYLVARELNDRIIDVQCAVLKTSLGDLRTAMRNISAWLNTRSKVQLIFDDEPGKYYLAKLSGPIDINQTFTLGEFGLKFRCEPYAYAIATTLVQALDTVFLFPNYPTPAAIGLSNLGTAPTFPKFTITFTAPATEYKLVLGNYFMRVVRNFIVGDVLVMDHAISKVTVNGLNAMLNLDLGSRFFQVPVYGSTVTPSPIGVATILVSFNGRWF